MLGNVYIAGKYNGNFTLDASNQATSYGGDDVFIAKFSYIDGSIEWLKSFGSPDNDNLTLIKVDDSSNVYVSGIINDTTSGLLTIKPLKNKQSSIIVKIDKNGMVKSSQKFNYVHKDFYNNSTNIEATKDSSLSIDINNDTIAFSYSMENNSGGKISGCIKMNKSLIEYESSKKGISLMDLGYVKYFDDKLFQIAQLKFFTIKQYTVRYNDYERDNSQIIIESRDQGQDTIKNYLKDFTQIDNKIYAIGGIEVTENYTSLPTIKIKDNNDNIILTDTIKDISLGVHKGIIYKINKNISQTNIEYKYIDEISGIERLISIQSNKNSIIISGIKKENEKKDVFIIKYIDNGIPTNIKNLQEKEIIRVYPNPCKDKLYIDGYNNHKYDIYNLSGQIMISGIYKDEISVKSLNKGLYFLKINDKTVKFLKQ
jgi:hypothetical protein